MRTTGLCLLLVVATSGCATTSRIAPPVELAVAPPMRVEPAATLTVVAVPPITAPRFILTPRNTRLVISVAARRLWVIAGTDTLHTAPVSVASGRDLAYAGRTWRFATPRGRLVFDGKLFIPPLATHNRRLQGELGQHALDLGNGYMLHGTADQLTIGSNTTHGCIRLADGDLTWLYTSVPVGVVVLIR